MTKAELLGAFLQKSRDLAEVSMTDVFERLGFKKSSMNTFEAGVTVPSFDKIVLLQNLYGCDKDKLLKLYTDAVAERQQERELRRAARRKPLPSPQGLDGMFSGSNSPNSRVSPYRSSP